MSKPSDSYQTITIRKFECMFVSVTRIILKSKGILVEFVPKEVK